MGPGHRTTARGPACEPSMVCAVWDPVGRPGVGPGLFSCAVVDDRDQWSPPPGKVVETRRLELLTLSLQRRCSSS